MLKYTYIYSDRVYFSELRPCCITNSNYSTT